MPISEHLKDYQCTITRHQRVGNDLMLMEARPKNGTFCCRAGQFVMINLPSDRFYFRRPMSVLHVGEDGTIAIFYKVHGKGTAMMAAMTVGETIEILGPLGNTFREPDSPETGLLLGGGIGIAPLYYLGLQLKSAGKPVPWCLYGVRSARDIGLLEPLQAVFGKKLLIATDDGSQGFCGNVCQLLESRQDLLQLASAAAICGPTVMMQAAAALLEKHCPQIRIEVSLEERMPCGTGACTGCVVSRTDQLLPSKTCQDGPVFEARQIVWPGTSAPAASSLSCKEDDAVCP